MSKDIEIYRDAASGVVKGLPNGTAKIYTFGSYDDPVVGNIMDQVRKDNPKIVVAVGSKAAAESAKAFPQKPLIYLMVVYPERLGLADREDTYGVSWSASPKGLARTFRELSPKAKKIGMVLSVPREVWDPWIEDFSSLGLQLVVSSIKSASEIPSGLRNLHSGIDLLWMGLDPALSSESAYNILRSYCLQNKIPLAVPFDLPEKSQTLAGISIAPQVAGSEAQKLLLQILEGKKPANHLTFADPIRLSLDLDNARQIGLEIPESVVKSAEKVHRR